MGRHISKVVTAIIVISLYLIFVHNDQARFGGFVSTTTTRFHRGAPSAQALRATKPVLDLLNEKAHIEPPVDSKHNLAAQNEGVSYGPWILLTPIPSHLTTAPFTLKFKCTWQLADLCPDKYIVILRGPTIYTPPASAIAADPADPTIIAVTLTVPDPGHYLLYAWPDFNECRKLWKEMSYPMNKGAVQSSPFPLRITGAHPTDSLRPCALSDYTTLSTGRWVARKALTSPYAIAPWTEAPDNQAYIFAPYQCKPAALPPSHLTTLKSVKHTLFLGDSVMRGAFCTQLYPALSPTGKSDGPCTFVNDAALYHIAPKDLVVEAPHGQQRYSFRFMDDNPLARLNSAADGLATPPTHIVANLGLWLASRTPQDYEKFVEGFLGRVHELWPEAVVVWRTTTDVAPMIQCFTDKGMTRGVVAEHRVRAGEVVGRWRERGMKVWVVDAGRVSEGRVDAGNDGRHWVVESPGELGWLPKSRPEVGVVERTVGGMVVEIFKRAEEEGVVG